MLVAAGPSTALPDSANQQPSPPVDDTGIGDRSAAPRGLPAGPAAERVADFDPFPHSARDLGGVGLLQMPTARLYPDGQFEFGANFLTPHTRYFLSWTILPWLEATFRYTDTRREATSSGLVAPGTVKFLKDIFVGDLDSTLDRGLDLKLKLADETEVSPEIVLGFQDVVGTGLFQGEYFAASKRYYDMDVTVGVGWGVFAGRAFAKNPLARLSSHFKTRVGFSGQGGEPSLRSLFTGPNIGLFGGIEYWLPWQRTVSLKLEYNSTDPSLTPLVKVRKGFPVDVGVNWRPYDWLDLGAGFERGNALMLKVSARTNLHSAHAPVKIDLPPDPVVPREQVAKKLPRLPQATDGTGTGPDAAPPAPGSAAGMSAVPPVRDIFHTLARQGVVIRAMRLQDRTMVVEAEIPSDPNGDPDLAAARAIAAWWPRPGQTVVLIGERHGIPVTKVAIRTDDAGQGAATPAFAIDRRGPGDAMARGWPPEDGGRHAAPRYDLAKIADKLFADLAARGFMADALRISGHQATVWVRQLKYRHAPQTVGRVARVMADDLPPSVEALTVVVMPDGLEVARATLLRSDLERIDHVPAEVLLRNGDIHGPGEGGAEFGVPRDAMRNESAYPHFTWSLAPTMKSNIGSQQGLYLFDVNAEAFARVEIARGLSMQGAIDRRIWGNLDQIEVHTESKLPHVRTYLDKYLEKGRNLSIPFLQADYLFNVAPNTFGRLSAGMFEPMYGGVDGEILYKPFDWPVGFALEANWVRQRGFHQLFSFRDYSVVTGHASIYWQLPFYDLTAAVHGGRYLARDWGATFEISRQFASGVRVGAFFTKTNVSAEQFGEGSFDKGFYMVIPFDLFSFTPTRTSGTFLFRPITRDGGAMVGVGPKLYEVVTGDGSTQFETSWPNVVY
jgi:hypothetical protein